ncbi:MAG: thioredoxin domain-containing protein [Hyphomicrobiaceae bacterium]|nr:MAG: thioredoxin domain-containing protein [Hyphomicrobiaceae bacterium]
MGLAGSCWRAGAGLILAALAGCGDFATPAANVAEANPQSQLTATRDTDPSEPLAKIEKPTLADIAKPGPLPERFLGRRDAPVTIYYYASLTCPYCRAFHAKGLPELKRLYIDKGKVRLVVREFPIGKSAGTATIALRCAEEGKYFRLLDRYLAEQGSWVSQEVRHDAILAVAKKEGMTEQAYNSCLANQSMINGLKAVKERGRQLGVIGTPSFFVEETRLKPNPSLEDMKAAIDAALARKGTVAKSE